MEFEPVVSEVPRPAMKIASLLFAIVLIGSFGMAVLKPGKPQTIQPVPTITHTPLRPPIINDVSRYKHDGTQPTLMQATPSQKAEISWD